MRKPTTREGVYIAVLVVVLLGWMFLRESGSLGGAKAKEEELEDIGEAPIVELARLNLVVPEYDKAGRNLFKYGPPPQVKRPKPPPPPPPPPPKQAVKQPVKQPPKAPVKPTQPPKARPPQPSFKYLGHLGPKADRIAVFEAGKEMVLAREGDTVQKQFKVVEFKYEVVVLGYTDKRFKDETTELTIRR